MGKEYKANQKRMHIMIRIGIIGTGMLGKAVATRLLKSGYQLTVYNRTREKADQLKTLGATVADSPEDVAKYCLDNFDKEDMEKMMKMYE